MDVININVKMPLMLQ